MNKLNPRLRMFAGPNGSGKSTLKTFLPNELLGVYLNADEIEQEVRETGYLDLRAYGVEGASTDVLAFFAESSFLKGAGLGGSARALSFNDGCLDFSRVAMNSYLASVAVEFLRGDLIRTGTSFTFETVMSHPGKVQDLARAQRAGFRTYLYYVATDHPAINISRVKSRVEQGGHPVPEDRVVDRYHRSLDLLMDAIRRSDRAYLFDNSENVRDRIPDWIVEVTGGTQLELKSNRIPTWFRRAVLDKQTHDP